MEEILFSIGAAIFAIFAAICGVRRSTRLGTNGRVRDDGSRLNDLVSDNKRLGRDKERISELDKRDVSNLRRCSEIGKRIRKREQETTTSE